MVTKRKPAAISSPPTTTLPSFPSVLSLEENFFNSNTALLPIEGFPFYTCEICFESKPLNDSFNVEGCTHFYCTKCTAKYIVSKLQDNVLKPMCPDLGCSVGALMNPHYCKQILPNNVLDWWEKALNESVIPEKDKLYCPFNDCSALLLLNDIVEYSSSCCVCPHCKREICVKCKAPWHTELSCDKFQRMKDRNDDLMLDLVERKKWRKCPNCKHGVEKIDGCDEMKCRLVGWLIYFISSSSLLHNVIFFNH